MKKTSFLLPIAMLSMLTFATPAANANAGKVYKQTATVYQIKKTGKTYKITSQTKKTTDTDISVGKTITIKGQRYYYSHVFKGYITDKAFALNAKLDRKRAKVSGSFATDKNKDKNNDSSTNSNPSSNTNSNIQNGYDNDTDTIINFSEYQHAYIQTMLNEINNYRTSHGLNALTLDPALTQIAQTRAQQNYEYRNDTWFDGHRDQNGNLLYLQLANAANIKYGTIAENGSYGFSISGMDAIMENPIDAAKGEIGENYLEGPTGGHYQNMMNPNFTKVGLGVFTGPNNGQQTQGGTDEVYSN